MVSIISNTAPNGSQQGPVVVEVETPASIKRRQAATAPSGSQGPTVIDVEKTIEGKKLDYTLRHKPAHAREKVAHDLMDGQVSVGRLNRTQAAKLCRIQRSSSILTLVLLSDIFVPSPNCTTGLSYGPSRRHLRACTSAPAIRIEGKAGGGYYDTGIRGMDSIPYNDPEAFTRAKILALTEYVYRLQAK